VNFSRAVVTSPYLDFLPFFVTTVFSLFQKNPGKPVKCTEQIFLSGFV